MSARTRKTVSMDSRLYGDALERARKLGYSNFSEYIQFLIEDDVSHKSAHIIERTEETGEVSKRVIYKPSNQKSFSPSPSPFTPDSAKKIFGPLEEDGKSKDKA